MNINNLEFHIKKSWYNKSYLNKDSKIMEIDTNKSYPLYELNISKNYFDIEDKEEVVTQIISDLENLIVELKELKEKNKER